jgi:microcystin-dependent protein
MDPFIGEIQLFAGTFAPKGWALCNGQLLPIAQNTALYSILGVQYGGDGKTTFALPNLQARAPLGQGQGPGLSGKVLGQMGGASTVTLSVNEMPNHSHLPNTQSVEGVADPTNAIWGKTTGARGGSAYGPKVDLPMNPAAIQSTGNSQPHTNMQPYVGINYIIALTGVFPPRG